MDSRELTGKGGREIENDMHQSSLAGLEPGTMRLRGQRCKPQATRVVFTKHPKAVSMFWVRKNSQSPLVLNVASKSERSRRQSRGLLSHLRPTDNQSAATVYSPHHASTLGKYSELLKTISFNDGELIKVQSAHEQIKSNNTRDCKLWVLYTCSVNSGFR